MRPQHRADRRWNFHHAATVMRWFYCWPQTASDSRSFTATRLGWLAAPLYLLLRQRPDAIPLGGWGGDAELSDAFEE
jgi:hypothetical protein